MGEFTWIFVLLLVVIVPLIIWGVWSSGAGGRLLEKAQQIECGMSKEEVFEILGNVEPREKTINKAKGTERYKWAAGQNTYHRQHIKGTGMSVGSSSHGRRYVTVIFKDNKVIEINMK